VLAKGTAAPFISQFAPHFPAIKAFMQPQVEALAGMGVWEFK